MDSQSIVATVAVIITVIGYGVTFYVKTSKEDSDKLEVHLKSKMDEMSHQLVVILEKITSIQINSAVYAKELDIVKNRVDNIDKELQKLKTVCAGRHGHGSTRDRERSECG